MLMVRGDSLISSEQGDPVLINGVEWQLGQQLGEGTSSTVYCASHGNEPPTRAVKVIQLQLLGSHERAALDEERALGRSTKECATDIVDHELATPSLPCVDSCMAYNASECL